MLKFAETLEYIFIFCCHSRSRLEASYVCRANVTEVTIHSMLD